MNCQEFDKHMKPFIEKTIDCACLDSFLEHYKSCPECREELEIKFLMAYLMKDQNETSFHLAHALNRHIEEEIRRKKRFYQKRIFQYVLISVSESLVFLTVIYFIFFIVLK